MVQMLFMLAGFLPWLWKQVNRLLTQRGIRKWTPLTWVHIFWVLIGFIFQIFYHGPHFFYFWKDCFSSIEVVLIWCDPCWNSSWLTIHIWTFWGLGWVYHPTLSPPIPYYVLTLEPASHWPSIKVSSDQSMFEASPILQGCWKIIIPPIASHIIYTRLKGIFLYSFAPNLHMRYPCAILGYFRFIVLLWLLVRGYQAKY